jgi:hypothetical protein
MTIEFESPRGAVDGSLIREMSDMITEMHDRLPSISRAKVTFREDATPFDRHHFICETSIDIFGNAFSVVRKGLSYEMASREALQAVGAMVDDLVKREHEPPDTETSTVNV